MTAPVLTEVPDLVRGLTLEQYHGMIDAGLFGDGDRVELLWGELVEMSPNGPAHASTLTEVGDLLRRTLPNGWRVRLQLPITTGSSEPEPDVAIVREGDYSRAHPTTALLVVEVAVSSTRVDLRIKPAIYAAAGIPEYWVLDVDERVVHVHREPTPTGYAAVTVHRDGPLVSGTDPVVTLDPEAVLPRV